MSQGVIELECPGCAAPLTTSTKTCPKCFRPIVISTLNTISGFSPIDLKKQANTYSKAMVNNPDNDELNMSIAFCYMKLKLYDKAIPCFEKALEENFDNADAYFYAAIALLKGKKAFLAQRDTINKIIEYIDAANMIEPKGIYHYFLAYIKYDYFERKSLNNRPMYRECLKEAVNLGLSETDVSGLFELLGVERPNCL
ncbi:MAG: hypothetical protein IKQ00_06450 [Butyrivibrio sp.]|nr:hypothetical protein [Butyrivibrio sp.]